MALSNPVHFNIVISGRVQGVGYRYSALRHAKTLGITGYVKNLSDGRVKLVIEGTEQAVEEMIVWCKEGPPMGRVDDLQTSSSNLVGFTDFTIR